MDPQYAIGRYTAAALRAKPKENAEMISQVLLGEPLRVLQYGRNWCHVQCAEDGFEGHLRTNQLSIIDELMFLHQKNNPSFALDLFSPIMGNHNGMQVTIGCRLPDFDGMHLSLNNQRYVYSGQAAMSRDIKTEGGLMLKLARRLLFTPHLTGGRTPTGIDAPALIQLVARIINVQLPRTAEAQASCGRAVDFIVQCQAGDLAFFDDPKGNINHVGLLLPESRIIHVNDRVRIDAIDHYGIYNYELGKYTHRLRIVKRLLPDSDQPSILMEKRPKALVDEQQIAMFSA
jgi:cell wall-associated NlpC family hydrolase